MSSASTAKGQDVDLDLFLTAVESKLRAPFSSLDLTKTVVTPALRGDVSEVEYLKRIAQVLSKSDKISQMRILISLLGLDPEPEVDAVIYSMLQQAQGIGEFDEHLTAEEKLANRFDDWVRVIAGLIQGIMFKEEDGEAQCFGEEARQVVETTCSEIIQKVEKLADDTSRHHEKEEEEDPSAVSTSLMTVDFDPIMAPYRYGLINPNLLKEVIPDSVGANVHFNVNEEANVLNWDAKMELARAKEELEHAVMKQAAQRSASGNSERNSVTTPATPMAYMPGMKQRKPGVDTTATTKKAPVNRPKSSMFLTKKPSVAAGAAGRGGGGLHVRKRGAAQGLVGKSRQLEGGQGSAVEGSSGVAPSHSARGGITAGSRLGNLGGRALKANAAANAGRSSKMKMIEESEATNLAKQQQEQEQQQQQQQQQKLVGSKRKAMAGNQLNAAKVARTPKADSASIPAGNVSKAVGAAEKMASPMPPPPPPLQQQEQQIDEQPDADEHDIEVDHDLGDNNRKKMDKNPTASANALAAAALSKYQTQVSKNSSSSSNNNNNNKKNNNKNNNKTKLSSPPPPPPGATKPAPVTTSPLAEAELAAAALSRYQTKLATEATPPRPPPPPRQLNWEELLRLKSNKLTDADRQRVQQFFVDRINPTPGQSTYKMKLHEERTTDPNSGQPVKETYYLELDYSNFTSKQSKKVKRYD